MSDTKRQQVKIAEEIQLLWLQRMKDMLLDKTITSTDLATLQRFLSANGWSVDPHQLPQELKDKLLSRVDPKKFDEDDADILPISRAG